MLGPSVIAASTPAAFLYVLSVVVSPGRVSRLLAMVALAACTLELFLLLALCVSAVARIA